MTQNSIFLSFSLFLFFGVCAVTTEITELDCCDYVFSLCYVIFWGKKRWNIFLVFFVKRFFHVEQKNISTFFSKFIRLYKSQKTDDLIFESSLKKMFEQKKVVFHFISIFFIFYDIFLSSHDFLHFLFCCFNLFFAAMIYSLYIRVQFFLLYKNVKKKVFCVITFVPVFFTFSFFMSNLDKKKFSLNTFSFFHHQFFWRDDRNKIET